MSRNQGRRKKSEQSLEIPVTPMLDMAFQLLTFFILTYQPMPAEGQFVMNIMPAAPATDINAQSPETTQANPDVPAALRTLPTTLRAGEGGELGRIILGENDIQGGMDELKQQLDEIFRDPTLPFDQTMIKVDPDLKYAALMQVIDVFSRAFNEAKKEPKLSFAELSPEELAAP
ncbi:biopolymer transporter ExbD [Singulisphaera sp. Ch08]|uniref:Biopolymer transporter ExbD n=1 Tax=Singulisphaera sp. Ch08 TaxID=3120278 RepID=A0AAU7CPQ9_9BACT